MMNDYKSIVVNDASQNKPSKATLERIRRSIEHSRAASNNFLKAWIEGVKIVGDGYFCHYEGIFSRDLDRIDSIEEATSVFQLSPNVEMIEKNIFALSSGESALLAVMTSFYNSHIGGNLMKELGIEGAADIAAKLDLQGREIISKLLVNYSGW